MGRCLSTTCRKFADAFGRARTRKSHPFLAKEWVKLHPLLTKEGARGRSVGGASRAAERPPCSPPLVRGDERTGGSNLERDGSSYSWSVGLRNRWQPRGRQAKWVPAVVCLLLAIAGCSNPAPRPSIVLAVLDTTRADAVSTYGKVAGSTPTVDALAQGGLLYEQAYSNSNWTLPSHASLFTGLLPSQNGIEGGYDVLGSVPTLAELLSRAGYETIGVNENPWLGPDSDVIRGFDRFLAAGDDMRGVVGKWLDTRQQGRPFFLFLNIMDAHSPYSVRQTNPFLPPGVGRERAQSVSAAFSRELARFLCTLGPDDEEMAVLRGLYLGDVRAGDAKLGSVLADLEPLRQAAPLIAIVTSDHGEYFGEHSLVEHQVGVGDAVLHVPLLVHGLPGVPPARIATPVQLVDVMPSILRWVGAPIPAGIFGRPLPTSETEQPAGSPIVAEYHDYIRDDPGIPEILLEFDTRKWKHCGPEDRIFGRMRAITRFPHKLIWYARYPSQLFDLSTDRREERDLAASMPETATELMADLDGIVRVGARTTRVPKLNLDAAQIERLRALGYLGGEAASQAESPPPASEPGAASGPAHTPQAP